MNKSKYFCIACSVPISQANHLISQKNHRLSLCLDHQTAVKGKKSTRYAKKLYLALRVNNIPAELEYDDNGKKKVDIALPGILYIEVEGRHHREPKFAIKDLTRVVYSLQGGIPTIAIPNELIHDNTYFELAVKQIVTLTRELIQYRG